MPTFHLEESCKMTHTLLKKIAAKLETYLNQVTLQTLVETSDPSYDLGEFYRGYIQDLRHLLVNCENTYERLGITLRRAQFSKEFAEEGLYQAYHACVNQFFYPKNESYEEDGRYSYTDRDSIIFRHEIESELKTLTLELSKMFEELREELLYFETDYVTKKRMKS